MPAVAFSFSVLSVVSHVTGGDYVLWRSPWPPRPSYRSLVVALATFLRVRHSILIENLGETLEAVLTPVIQRAVIYRGRKMYIKLGDSEVEFHPDFRWVNELARPCCPLPVSILVGETAKSVTDHHVYAATNFATFGHETPTQRLVCQDMLQSRLRQVSFGS